jgi:hypothetical protein
VFENRVPRRIFGLKRDEVTGDWRELHNEEFHNLYSSPNIIRMIKSRRTKWSGHVARMRRKGMLIEFIVGKPGGKKVGRPRLRWEDDIKLDLNERENGILWTGFIWLRIGTSGWLL